MPGAEPIAHAKGGIGFCFFLALAVVWRLMKAPLGYQRAPWMVSGTVGWAEPITLLYLPQKQRWVSPIGLYWPQSIDGLRPSYGLYRPQSSDGLRPSYGLYWPQSSDGLRPSYGLALAFHH
jgi:hypothetical protein